MKKHLILASILLAFSFTPLLSEVKSEDLTATEDLKSQGIIKKSDDIKINLPSQFSVNQIGGLLYRSFKINRSGQDVGTSGGIDGMGSTMKGGFFRYSRYWWQNAKGELIAESSIRFFRTARIYDNKGSYLGKIHKKYFTWFSGRPELQIYNKEDELVAQLKLEDDASDQKRRFSMEYANVKNQHHADTYGDTIAILKYSRSSDGKNDLWLMDIFADSEAKFFNAQDIDPRIIPFIPVYISYWDNIEKLDH